jgi:hypothetical protein
MKEGLRIRHSSITSIDTAARNARCPVANRGKLYPPFGIFCPDAHGITAAAEVRYKLKFELDFCKMAVGHISWVKSGFFGFHP